MANHGPPDGSDPESWPPGQPPGRSRGRTVAVLAVLALLVPGGVTGYLLARTGDVDPPPPAAPPPVTTAAADRSPAAPPDVSPSVLAPEASADPRFAREGQCMRNDGPVGGRPKLLVTGCAPRTYEVLRRFDGATSGEQDAEAKCAEVDGYTDWYFHNSELDTLDFVLCLRLQ